MSTSLQFAIEPSLAAGEFIDVMRRSTLADRRPSATEAAIEPLLRSSDVIATARHDGRLVGVARSITDFSQCTYLADLAVDESYQRRGIGRELVRRTHEAAGLSTMLVLLAAPAAASYYPQIGMTPHGSCWIIPRPTP